MKRYGGEMPNVGMSRKDAKKIIAWLGEASPASKPAETVATPGLVAMGRALFTGGRFFSKGGAPCAGCHGFGYSG